MLVLLTTKQPHNPAQATGGRPRNSCCQTVPQSLPEEEAEDLMAAPGFAAFLEAVRPRWVYRVCAASE